LTTGHFGPVACSTITRRLYGDEEEEGREEDGQEDREEEEVVRGDAQGPARLPAPRISSILRRVILYDERRQIDLPVAGASARLGRDPSLDIAFEAADDVVSAVHARVWREPDGSWWLEDLESTNGTWLNSRRIGAAERLATGDRFTLGQRGPALRVRIPGEPRRTLPEPPVDPAIPVLRLRRVAGGEDLHASGREVLLGRAATCTIPLRTVADTVVSARHASVAFDEAGAATISDLGSRNGTFVNGQQIRGPAMLKLGDRIMLGWHGPLFEVRVLGGARLAEGEGAAYRPELQPPKTLAGMVQVARGDAGARGHNRVVSFARSLARQMARESSRTFRVGALAVIAALVLTVALVWRSAARERASAEQRLAGAERAFAAQLAAASAAQMRADSVIGRLRRDLASARRASVPNTVVESLETQLKSAEARAAAPTSSATVADFSRVSRENQGAVGLVIARYPADSVMGSGFVITPSGYLLTSGHVVRDPARGAPRALEVVMADSRAPLPADLVAASDLADEDIAVLKIRNYRGPVVRALDWAGTGVQQGAPAALIGFPRGTELAFDRAGVVRTTMFAGVIAKATREWIEFAGFTDAGSSGSPVFNAGGAVIGVHYGAFAAPGGGTGTVPLGFAVPIGLARSWLPAQAKSELGL
jgi:pSer/pThr/pTyr-binding forkhead associated (FHA) protein/S1-C subfamily serine protease